MSPFIPYWLVLVQVWFPRKSAQHQVDRNLLSTDLDDPFTLGMGIVLIYTLLETQFDLNKCHFFVSKSHGKNQLLIHIPTVTPVLFVSCVDHITLYAMFTAEVFDICSGKDIYSDVVLLNVQSDSRHGLANLSQVKSWVVIKIWLEKHWWHVSLWPVGVSIVNTEWASSHWQQMSVNVTIMYITWKLGYCIGWCRTWWVSR